MNFQTFPVIKTERLTLRKIALKSVVNFGFIELYIERIKAFTHIQNEKSKNLLLKNGFKIIEDRKDNDDLFNIVFEIRKSK